MAEKVFDKHEAAEYVGTTEANLFYHHYNSGALKGGKLRYGRLTWTKAQLDTFKETMPRPGFKERPGVQSVTVSTFFKEPEYKGMLDRGEMRFTYGEYEVLSVAQNPDNTRQYVATMYPPGGDIRVGDDRPRPQEYVFWNNARFVMTPLDKTVPPGELEKVESE